MKPQKDEANEHPVPIEWRTTFRDIVMRFVRRDYQLTAGVTGVSPVTGATATQIADYVDDYGEKLVPLSEETWSSSVAQWMGDRWEVLVDLCTESEGISDLVLHAIVREDGADYSFEIHMVYVP